MAVKIRLAQRGKKKTRTYRVVVADARSPRDGKFIEDLVSSRQNLNFILSKPENIDYIDVSPKQLVSVAASLIPFSIMMDDL